jgi:hypothetical protein
VTIESIVPRALDFVIENSVSLLVIESMLPRALDFVIENSVSLLDIALFLHVLTENIVLSLFNRPETVMPLNDRSN